MPDCLAVLNSGSSSIKFALYAAADQPLLFRGQIESIGLGPAPEAAEAIQLFVHRIVREIGSLAAALGGLDGLVFTAGIGESDPATRFEVAFGCAWLGLELNPARNRDASGRISAKASRIQAWVVPTNEELMIARHAAALLA